MREALGKVGGIGARSIRDLRNLIRMRLVVFLGIEKLACLVRPIAFGYHLRQRLS